MHQNVLAPAGELTAPLTPSWMKGMNKEEDWGGEWGKGRRGERERRGEVEE